MNSCHPAIITGVVVAGCIFSFRGKSGQLFLAIQHCTL